MTGTSEEALWGVMCDFAPYASHIYHVLCPADDRKDVRDAGRVFDDMTWTDPYGGKHLHPWSYAAIGINADKTSATGCKNVIFKDDANEWNVFENGDSKGRPSPITTDESTRKPYIYCA